MATPIGNLRDITLRALDVLQSADLIACEDTRVAGKLLRAFGLRAKSISYHDHNGDRQRPLILDALRADQVVALVPDAGTPLISDPGYKLVQAAITAGLPVTALPGASAALTALQLSGLPPDCFLFAGFPGRGKSRRTGLQALQTVPASLIFYESSYRLADSLAEMHQVFGDRPAAVARELTKLHEEVRRGRLAALAAYYADAANSPKGEIVVVVGPPDPENAKMADCDATALLQTALTGGLRLRDAVDAVAGQTGLDRRRIYRLALSLERDDAPAA